MPRRPFAGAAALTPLTGLAGTRSSDLFQLLYDGFQLFAFCAFEHGATAA